MDGKHSFANLYSWDQTIVNFTTEYNDLLKVEKSLKPALFEQALLDLLEKYDMPISR